MGDAYADGEYDIEKELFFAMEEETEGLGMPNLDMNRIRRSGRRRAALLAGSATALVAVVAGVAVALSGGSGGAKPVSLGVAGSTTVTTAPTGAPSSLTLVINGRPAGPGDPTIKEVMCMVAPGASQTPVTVVFSPAPGHVTLTYAPPPIGIGGSPATSGSPALGESPEAVSTSSTPRITYKLVPCPYKLKPTPVPGPTSPVPDPATVSH